MHLKYIKPQIDLFLSLHSPPCEAGKILEIKQILGTNRQWQFIL